MRAGLLFYRNKEDIPMQKEKFRVWLSTRIKKKPGSDCMSRCRAIEKALKIDLDNEYRKDKGERLLTMLYYSAEDERNGKKCPDGFKFKDGVNIRFRLTNLKCAANKYFEFCSDCEK